MIVSNLLSGSLGFISFADILQLLGSTASSGVLEITDDKELIVKIFFEQGEVIHAKTDELKGEDAFFIPFSWDKGYFKFLQNNEKVEKTIENNLTGLILEGLRLLDEGRLSPEDDEDNLDSKVPLLRGRFIDYAEIVDEEFFEKNEIIVREGRYGSWIWVILDGLVQIEKKFSGKNIPVIQLGRGGFIGSLAAFARGDRPRSATVRAVSSVQLGVLDAQSLSKEYSAYSDLLRSYFMCIDDRLKKITDAYVRVFSNGIREVAHADQMTGIIPEKLKNNNPGVVTSGSAQLYIECMGNFLSLGKIKKGEIVGELPFVETKDNYNFYLEGDLDFSIEIIDKNELLKEFSMMSENIKKMVEFAGLSLSQTASSLSAKVVKLCKEN
jgi:CRP-like cAMP-binding protein